MAVHKFVRLFAAGGAASMKPGSLVKKGTIKSSLGAGVPGIWIEAAEREPLLAPLTLEEWGGATAPACL